MQARKKTPRKTGTKTQRSAPGKGRTGGAGRESADKYRQLVELTNTGFVILDDLGRVVDANEEYVRLTGRAKLKDILGRPVTDWTAAYDLQRNAAEVAKCLQTGSVRGLIIDYVGPTGAIVPIEVNAAALPGPPARIFTVCRDISERKHAEQELADREGLLRQIMDTASVAIFLVNKDGRITHANQRMAAMFGCTVDELIGSEYVAHVHPSEREIGRKKMLALLASQIQFVDLERHYRRKDGTEFWGHLAGKRFHDLQGSDVGLIGVITDIDSRKRAEETLRESEAKYRLVVENAAEGILIAQDGKIKFMNPWMRAVGGYSAGDMLDKPFSQFVHPEDREFVYEQHIRRLKGEIPLDHFYDFRVLTKSGDVLWVEMKGALTNWEGRPASVNFISNITERKRAEERIRQSERMLQTIIDTEPDCIKVLDAESRLLMMNRAGLDMLQVDSLEQVQGQFVCPLVAPSYQQAFSDLTRRVFQGESGSLEFQMVGMRGRRLWLETHAVPLRNEKNEITALLGVTRDITGRKQVEEALRESEARTRSIIESIPVGMHMYRLEPDGRLVFTGANPAADRILSVDNRLFVGKTIEEAFPPLKDTEVPRRYREVVESGTPWQTESIEYKDNAIAGAFEVHAFRTGPDTMVAAFEVITERKRAEQSLKESEAKYRRLYNETPVMLHSIDRNAVVVDVNDHWLKVMGYERKEVIGRSMTDFYTPTSAKHAREVVQPAFLRDGVVKDVSYQFVKKNGEVVDVLLSATAERDAAGNVVRSQAVITDVTERKRAEEALRRSEARYRALYEGTPVMMHSIDPDGKLISVSDHWLRTLGYAREEVLGRRSTEFLDEPSRTYARTVVLPDFMRSGVCNDIPYTFVKKNGELLFTLLSAIAERDAAGNIVRSLAVIIDITKRRQAEDKLRESEERYRQLFEAESDAIFLIDNETGRILMANAAASAMYGFSLEELLAKKNTDLSAEPSETHRVTEATPIRKDTAVTIPLRYHSKKDGTVFPVEITGRFFTYKDRPVHIAAIRDITERKRAEEEVRRNEARTASLFRISQQAVENEQAFLDLALNEAISLTGSTIGYLYFYDEAKREFNLNSYSRDVMKECSIVDRKSCYELDRTGIWGEAVRQRKPIILNDYEAEHLLKKGYPEGHVKLSKFLTIPVIMQEAVVAVVGVANKQADYTDADVVHLNFLMDSVWKMIKRARAERALQESEERFRDLAQTLPLTIFELDLQGRLTYVNRAALDKFGYTRQDVEAGVNVMEVVAPQDRDRARTDMVRRISGGGPLTSEYLGLRKDGSTFPVMVASNPILQDGQPAGLRGIVMDLTERKELEEERLKTQKLESIGTLAGGIAHDFNNLLQGIFGYISMAKLTHVQKEKSIAMLEQAEKALHQAVNLTSQLLTFSKGGKPVKKVVALLPIIESACNFALSGARSDCRITADEGLWSIEADEGQLGQVIQNIVLNADQAMPLGGTVSVHARNVPESETGAQRVGPGKCVEILIRDKGVGISAEYLSKIFDPYFTTKEKGSGLGLATSYSIIKNHGGAINVTSEPGKGTTFTILLPAVAQEAEPVPVAAAPRAVRKGRILVMDDEEIVRKVAYELLTGLEHDVELAAHGDEAIDKYREARASGKPFDIVILDLTIRGGMGGVEALQKLREIDPGVKAVVSSGYSDDAVMSNHREHGFASFLKKPYALSGLREMLDTLLR